MFNYIIQIMLNIDIIEMIDWILRIIGILSIFACLISLFLNRYEFNVNVYINRIEKNEVIEYKNAIEYIDTTLNGEYLIFIPQGNTNFKNVKYCEYIFTGKKFKKSKVIKMFNNINCTNGLVIKTYYPCGVPSRIIQWEADYGVKGYYIIAENGKDGDVKFGNYLYKYNIFSNLRKILNWK